MLKRVLEEKRVGVHEETAKLQTHNASGVSEGRVLAGTGLAHI